VAHLLTPHVNLGYSGTLLPPQSKGLSGFTTVLCCTWQSEPGDTPDGASGIFTPAKASLPLLGIKPGTLWPKANTLPLHHPSPRSAITHCAKKQLLSDDPGGRARNEKDNASAAAPALTFLPRGQFNVGRRIQKRNQRAREGESSWRTSSSSSSSSLCHSFCTRGHNDTIHV
jgi:hypothetical protein